MFGEDAVVTDLDLSTNNLGRLPPSVARLSALTSLNISDNGFLAVPTELMRCGVAAIGISDFSCATVDLLLKNCSLKKLKTLNISYILAPTLPDFLLEMQGLVELSAYGNPLGEFPRPICHMRTLKTLVCHVHRSRHPQCKVMDIPYARSTWPKRGSRRFRMRLAKWRVWSNLFCVTITLPRFRRRCHH